MSKKIDKAALQQLVDAGMLDSSIESMVRAALAGKVTQSISVVKPAPRENGKGHWPAKLAVAVAGKRPAWIAREVAEELIRNLDETRKAIAECAKLDKAIDE